MSECNKINVQDSSEIVVGALMNYEQPVIYHQYMRASESEKKISNPKNFNPYHKIRCCSQKLFTIILVCFILSIGLLSGIYLAWSKLMIENEYEEILFDQNYKNGTSMYIFVILNNQYLQIKL